MTIKEWQQRINKWAEEKGWNEDLNLSADSIGKQVTNMHSELSEAWEEIKDGRMPTTASAYFLSNGIRYDNLGSIGKNKPEGFPIELADCVIRILHTCEFYGIDLEEMMEVKQRFNETRSWRHGGKKA